MSISRFDNCRTYVYINIKDLDNSMSSINTTDDVENGWADIEKEEKPKTHIDYSYHDESGTGKKPKIDMSLLDY